MPPVIRVRGEANDLSNLVDVRSMALVSAKCAQVLHNAVGGSEGMPGSPVITIDGVGLRFPDDLTGIVDGTCEAPITPQGAKVGHGTVFPEGGMVVPAHCIRPTNDL